MLLFSKVVASNVHKPRLSIAPFQLQISRSHKGAAGMRSVLTFVNVVWIVDARVER
jgi:hypothetical protein